MKTPARENMLTFRFTGIVWLMCIFCTIAGIAQPQLPDTVCQGSVIRDYYVSGWVGSTYTWTVQGGTVIPPGNTASIQVDWSGVPPGAYSITVVEKAATGCSGDPLSGIVYVVPPPQVTLGACFDTMTTTGAQPIRLKGGIPYGGIYSGPGVANGLFNPSAAGAGLHRITYTFSNAAGCASSASRVIRTFNSQAFTCGQSFTDIRDGTVYSTFAAGSQCWFTANLNFGSRIPASEAQRDNCSSEKYCYNDSLSNCVSKGGLYQWDEVMRYERDEAVQGFCPPGWHLPSETEWLALISHYNGAAYAGDALKPGGASGFDAVLSGAHFMNREYDFGGFAVFYWTSTPHTAVKAWSHALNDPDHGVSTYPASVQNGFYVRCLKD